MACDHDWTLKFRGVNGPDKAPFEVRPISMSFTDTRDKYDYCRAKLPWEVGEEMKPHTESENGRLGEFTRVDVCYDGKTIQPLLFRPDWVEYGNQFTHIELKDLQKALGDGVVDEQRESVQLKEIYRTIVDSASNDVINEIKFTLPDNQVRTIYGGAIISQGSNENDMLRDLERISNREKETSKLVESNYAVDFQQITPEEAITKLNKKFRLKSWVNRDGVLIVGLPEANSIRHLAAPDDSRVWRWKDPSITHPREPVHSVVVKGSWQDEPGLEVNPFEWFDKGGLADVRAVGIAQRTDVEEGTTFTVDAKGAKRDSLGSIATIVLREEIKRQNAGTVEIDPALSGEAVSSLIDVQTGDFIQLVPDDDLFENPDKDSGEIGDKPENWNHVCGTFVNNEAYLISEVEHSVTEQGDWQVFLDLALVPDVPITSKFTYFDPRDDKYVDPSKIDEGGDLKGGWLSLEDI